jgi:hypothetical protein
MTITYIYEYTYKYICHINHINICNIQKAIYTPDSFLRKWSESLWKKIKSKQVKVLNVRHEPQNYFRKTQEKLKDKGIHNYFLNRTPIAQSKN